MGGLQTYPGEHPKTAEELESCGVTEPAFVGDGQVISSVTVTVDPGSVIYAVDPVKVAPILITDPGRVVTDPGNVIICPGAVNVDP